MVEWPGCLRAVLSNLIVCVDNTTVTTSVCCQAAFQVRAVKRPAVSVGGNHYGCLPHSQQPRLYSCQLSPTHTSFKVFHFTHSTSKVESYFHVSVTVSLRNFPPIVGRVLIVMDSNVHDVTEPMDDTVFEDSTCQSSESSRTIVNPEADVTKPMDDTEFEDSTCQSSESSRTIVNPEADVTEPMDDTEFEDSTCQSSESSRTIVNPEVSQTSHTPAQKQCQSCYWQQFQLTGSSQPQNFGYSKCIHLSFFPKFCRMIYTGATWYKAFFLSFPTKVHFY